MPSKLKGNCHCGSYRFEIHGADLKDLVKCGCGLCRKKGGLWVPLREDVKVDVTRDDGKIVKYRAEGVEHEFCSICGTTVRSEHTNGILAGRSTVNLRVLRGVNVFDYDPRPEKVSPQEVPAPPLTGSCYCGEVTIQLHQPFQDLEIKEDNCSICSRNAWIGIYPSQSQVTTTGAEHTQEYRFGRRFNGFPFCRTCGVSVFQNLYGPPQSVLDGLSDSGKERVKQMLDIKPINVRVLEKVVLNALDVKRSDEGTEGYEGSVLGFDEGEKGA